MSGKSERAQMVKKVMMERGVKLGEASKIVKAEGLYTARTPKVAFPESAPAPVKAAAAPVVAVDSETAPTVIRRGRGKATILPARTPTE